MELLNPYVRNIKVANDTPTITVVYNLFNLKSFCVDEKSAITRFFIEYFYLLLKLLLLTKLPRIGCEGKEFS